MEALDGRSRDAIRRTIEHLAKVCDHATSRDDVGFSANTASLGHELAHLPDRYWNDGTYVAAARIAFKHRQQALDAMALEDDMVETIKAIADGPHQEDVASAWMVVDRMRDGVVLSVARDMADVVRTLKKLSGASQPAGKGRLWAVTGAQSFALLPFLRRFDAHEGVEERLRRSARDATPDMIIATSPRVIDVDNGVFTLSFPYDPEAISAIKAIRRRRYDGKRWLVSPNETAVALLNRLCDENGFVPTGAATRLMEEAAHRPEEAEPVRPLESKEIGISQYGERVLLSFKYDAGIIESLKSLPSSERSYNPQRRLWSVERRSIPDLVSLLRALEAPPAEKSIEDLVALSHGPAPAP